MSISIIQIMNEKNCINEELPLFGTGQMEFEEDGQKYLLTYKVKKIQPIPLFRNKEWLTEEYITKERTMQSIANEFGVSSMAICHWLQKHDIDTRPRGRFSKD